jgi:hypothetical protein
MFVFTYCLLYDGRHVSRLKPPLFVISLGQIFYPKQDLSVSAVELSFEFTAFSLNPYPANVKNMVSSW